MRVILCIHSLRRGGAERVVLELACGLMKKGYDVLVVSWVDIDEHSEDRYRSVPREYLMLRDNYHWPFSVFPAARRFRRIMERFRPDIIAIHNPALCWVVSLSRPAAPTVHVLHGYGEITSSGPLKRRVTRILDCMFHRWLKSSMAVVSKPMAEAAAKYYAIGPQAIQIVPNGIDVQAFAATKSKASSTTNILMVGTVNAHKGQELAVTAFSHLLATLPEAVLTIVGDGPDRDALEQKVRETGQHARVRLLGRQEDIPALMAEATMVWHLSRSEGFGLTIAEAMAAGKPVIGFNVVGVRDIVINGETGFLVEYGDLQGIIDSTVKIARDEAFRKKMAHYARRLALAKYSLHAMISRHDDLLTATCEGTIRDPKRRSINTK